MEDLELDDRELLASLEVQEVVERRYGEQDGESGYGTLSDTFTQSSRSSSVRGLVSASSLRWVVMCNLFWHLDAGAVFSARRLNTSVLNMKRKSTFIFELL